VVLGSNYERTTNAPMTITYPTRGMRLDQIVPISQAFGMLGLSADPPSQDEDPWLRDTAPFTQIPNDGCLTLGGSVEREIFDLIVLCS
jgi:hypothetical protein